MRAVLDTNVLVSAVLAGGSAPDAVLRAWHRGDFQLVTSVQLISELEKVLARPHIGRRLGWSPAERGMFVTALSENSIVVNPSERLRVLDADPADNRVLEAAVSSGADYIVTGDNHLLDLGRYENNLIVTPAQFAAVLAHGL